MHHINLKFIALCSVVFSIFSMQAAPELKTYDQLLVVVLMVKDEATVMEATLDSYVKGGITSFFIFDTGSTDKTIEVTKNFFKKRRITSYYIEQEPFIDFSTSRNRALELAEEKFPRACFMLMPDAEWYLVNGKKLLEFCEQRKDETHPSYMIRILHTTMDFYTQRLIRVSEHCRFEGVVHEAVTKISYEKVPSDVYFDLRISKKGAEKTARRWQRDERMLLESYEKCPENPRTCFYLAQTYECLEDYDKAAYYYDKRTTLAGWDEENYEAWYRLAGVLEKLAQKDQAKWAEALECYLRAFTIRPGRAEPLIRVAYHYLSEGNHVLSFLFAQRACQIPYPINDVLFVEKELYDYARYDIMGQSAWYVGEFAIGEEAIRTAMKTRPDVPHLFSNLAIYLTKKQQLQRNDSDEDDIASAA